MHVKEESSLTSFIENSVHYQNEEVFMMYGLIFLVLGGICTAYYQHARYVERKARAGRQ